ncbi:MAG: RNA pseudouridine synthase [Flavobacteriaceae bacterium]|nr:RNA pseudouridine synthase [Flavobacteriaceae bacterium]
MVSVLWEDNHLLVVNKPAGLPVQGDLSGDTHLLEWAERYIAEKYNKPGKAFIGLVHRLDRPVSGVVVLAKTSKALTRMNEIFRDKKNTKIYHAITTKGLPTERGTLSHHLLKNGETKRAHAYNTPKTGTKPGVLQFELLKNFAGRYLYEITLETGRFHQIRAQLSKMGCPILGDLKYGANEPLPDRSIGLHSRRLISPHVVSAQASINVVAPHPKGTWWWDLFQ